MTTRFALYLALVLTPVLGLRAADQTWSGGGVTNGNWSTTANWLGGAAPGSTSQTNSNDVATFNAAILNGWGTSGTPIIINSPTQNIGGLTFTGAAGNFVIGTTGGNALRLRSSGVIQISSGLTAINAVQTVNAPIEIKGSSSFINNSANGGGAGSGTLLIGGGVTGTTGVTSLTLGGTNTNANTVSGSIGDGGAPRLAVEKSGTGTWVLSGPNSYTGATTISAGILRIEHGSALGDTAGDTSVTSGAALQLHGGITTLAEALTLNGTGISGTGALRNISGSNTYAGLIDLDSATRINSDAGTLTLSHAGTITGATLGLTVGGAGNTTIQSIIGTTSGTLTKDGAGTLTLSGANTYTGGTTISVGTLNLTNTSGSATGTGVVSLTAGAFLTGTGALNAGANAITLNGTLTIGDTTLGSPVVTDLALGTTSGTGITLGATGKMAFDLFSGAGFGNNTAIPTASDLLILTGNITINPAAQLLIGNPTGLSGFTIGDKWQLWNVAGLGTLTGGFSLAQIIAPALGSGSAWDFNATTGVLSIVPEPSRVVLMMLGLFGVILRRRR